MTWNKSFLFFILLNILGCKTVKYGLSGINIPPDVNSVSITLFDNKAALVNPLLSQVLTEKLKDRFTRQTSLRLVTTDGDWQFKGFISNYLVEAVNRQTIDGGTRNKLTITVNVAFTNLKNEKESFTKDFTKFQDFDAAQNFSNVESALVDQITDLIVTDIFNETALKW